MSYLSIEMTAQNSRVKVALVGIGGYGDSYVRALLQDPRAADVEFVAGADPAPQRCRRLADLQARGIPVYPSLEEVCARHQPELVILATPIHLHASQVGYCLDRGINVLCEKPLAGNLADAFAMLEKERNSKAFAAIGYQWSFSAAIQALKQDILTGVLGKPIRMRCKVSFPRGLDYFGRNRWAGRIKTDDGIQVLDSPVNNATAHYLHNMLYLLGPATDRAMVPQSIQAELYRANAIENYDTAALRCRTAQGTEILFYTTHSMAERGGPESIFEFERATVTYDAQPDSHYIARFKDGTEKSYGDPNHDGHGKTWQAVSAVRGRGSIVCRVATAIPHTLCVLGAQQSAITDFPKELCKLTTVDEQTTMIVVQGLNSAIAASYESGKLPAEMDAYPWSRPGQIVQLAPMLDGRAV